MHRESGYFGSCLICSNVCVIQTALYQRFPKIVFTFQWNTVGQTLDQDSVTWTHTKGTPRKGKSFEDDSSVKENWGLLVQNKDGGSLDEEVGPTAIF